MTLVYKKDDPIGNLLLYLNSKLSSSSAFTPAILPILAIEVMKKEKTIVKPGDTFRTIIWLDDAYGCSYKMIPDKNNFAVKQIVDFYPPKSIMLDADSFFNNKPVDCYFEIKNGTIAHFEYKNLEELKLTAPEVESLAASIMTEILKLKAAISGLKQTTGIERYEQFKGVYGKEIVQIYAQRLIAAFIGFNPQYLSFLLSQQTRSSRSSKQKK